MGANICRPNNTEPINCVDFVLNYVISPNSIYQQQELHVLVTVSLFMDLTITYEYQSPISNDINILCCVCFYFVVLNVSLGFYLLLCVCYVNPAYGCQIEINCVCELRHILNYAGWPKKLVTTK